ncbi:hypothetical protein F5B22DRAFT_600968 [Xylaria bambusicola]|uniref:uncharacterized protein n=1 Tax=Xylaria bambusicola TaxID=326684 RepID=UPI002007391C|nr:uncharacterized protein F5B22DRAFT_600968 [Xylaria bambusicola]KAI0517901.1 hypothetical protein F5B22DRAFT_600968 [Xylaria bambusicola]
MDNITYLTPSQLEAYAYRKQRIVDYILDDANLETRCPLDNGRHLIPPQDSLGQLDMLPLELLTCILMVLDLPSLTIFRRVNRRAMGVVDSLHQYQMVLKHCPNVLRAIISIDARYFDCQTLYRTLSTTKCEACDRFGSYLYLITCKRVCYFCFTGHPDYFPVSATRAAKYLSLPRKDIKHLPHILSLPGKYTTFCKLSRNRITLFDRQAILKSALKTSTLTTDASIRQQDLTTREPLRHMSIISAPCFGSSGLSADWGFYCTGCRESKELGKNLRNKYTANGIVDHIRRYGAVTVVDQHPKHV